MGADLTSKRQRIFGLEGYVSNKDPTRNMLLRIIESHMLVLNCCDRKESRVVLQDLIEALSFDVNSGIVHG
jgi:hypothetical protein